MVAPNNQKKIPITIVITTKNEEPRLKRCLEALKQFDEIIVVDSHSTDKTAAIARKNGARVVEFEWNGRYPKKRQWCLDNLAITFQNDWVFFVDADEVLTYQLVDELAAMDWSATDRLAGYFVYGCYVFEGKSLRFGMKNNKLALINWRKMEFPIVDDIGIEGMGEIEGHYQPVLKEEYWDHMIGQIKQPLLHEACEDMVGWHERHKRYAAWEAGMNAKNAWPNEDSLSRRRAKEIFRKLPRKLRAFVAFSHSYFYKLGILDGSRGYRFAALRASYYMQF